MVSFNLTTPSARWFGPSKTAALGAIHTAASAHACQRFTLSQTIVLYQPPSYRLTYIEHNNPSLWLTKPGRGAEVGCRAWFDRLVLIYNHHPTTMKVIPFREVSSPGLYIRLYPDIVLVASPPQTPCRQNIMTQANDNMAITLPAAIAAFSTLTLTVTPQRRPEITMDTPPSAPQTLTRSFQTAVPILSNPTTEVSNWYPASFCYLSEYTDIHSFSFFRWTHAADWWSCVSPRCRWHSSLWSDPPYALLPTEVLCCRGRNENWCILWHLVSFIFELALIFFLKMVPLQCVRQFNLLGIRGVL